MILDSCFLIDLMAGDEAAVAKLDELTERATPLSISSLTVTEVGVGLRSDVAIERFDELVESMDIVSFTHVDARRAARIQRTLLDDGERVGAIDAMITGTAIERGERILTRNVSEFRRIEDVRAVPY